MANHVVGRGRAIIVALLCMKTLAVSRNPLALQPAKRVEALPVFFGFSLERPLSAPSSASLPQQVCLHTAHNGHLRVSAYSNGAPIRQAGIASKIPI